MLIFMQRSDLLNFMFLGSDIACATVLTFSLLHIRSFAKELASDNIYPSNGLIAVQLGTMIIITLLDISVCILTVLVDLPILEGGDVVNMGAFTVSNYLDIATISTFFFNMMTILIMLMKFSSPLPPAKQAAIAVKFI